MKQILKIIVILFGVLLLIGSLDNFGHASSYSTEAGRAGAIAGTGMVFILALALIILPIVSLYRGSKK